MCHIVGFYLQHAHGYDLMKMKVDFNQDEFGEIWLMNAWDLCVRKSRYVPSDKGTQLADYVLQRMEDMKAQAELDRKVQEQKELELMNETDSAYETLNGSMSKRVKSLAPESFRKAGSLSRGGVHGRMHTANSQAGSPERSTLFRPAVSSYEKFRRVHPQCFETYM